MVNLHGLTVLRTSRYLLPLLFPACCALWMLIFFQSPTAVVRKSFQPRILWTEQRVIDATPTLPERREIIDTSPSQPPPPPPQQEGRETVKASAPPPPSVGRARTESPSPPPPAAPSDRCAGRYIYIHDVPSRFNSDLIRDCRSLCDWTDMCKHLENGGMGPRLTRTGGVLPSTGWYDTNQFTLEVMFHRRMQRYDCLTTDASRAAAVYVPYYAGLDVGRYLWGFSNGLRDALTEDLVEWLRSSPAWSAHGGRDHFLVGGRITWDFRRQDGREWGSRLLLLPEAMNMTTLAIESSPWHGNDVGVPYPTYFHPSRAAEVASWQRAVRRARRPWLFAFAGGTRGHGSDKNMDSNGIVRDAIIEQCAQSPRCGLLQCGARGRRNDCYAPANVMRLFKSAAFCLQPQGDSYTRKLAFDAMLAGCVPVFFHPGSAYVQYRWHLPADHRKYSVFVPEDGVRNGTVRVEDVLRRISARDVVAMREQLARMIPRIVYGDPRAKAGHGLKDAVDVAVEGVIARVRRIKQEMPLSDDGMGQWYGYFDKQ